MDKGSKKELSQALFDMENEIKLLTLLSAIIY